MRLVAQVAAALGLDPTRVRVNVDEASARATAARSASGLSGPRGVHLPPGLDPRSPLGRYVVAHEVAHVAQRDVGGRPSGRLPAAVGPAEREAHALARRFTAGLPLPRPLATLPAAHVAADVDWPGLAELRESLDAFVDVVAASRPFEWHTVQDAVGADGRVDRQHVDLVVRTLAGLDLPLARALLRRLPSAARLSLVQQLDDGHYEVHRPVVVAALAALEPADAAHLDRRAFARLDLAGLSTLEHDVLLLALSAASTDVVTGLLADDGSGAWRALVEGEAIGTTPVTLMDAQAAERVRAQAAAAARAEQAERADRLARELTPLCEQADGAREVVHRLAALESDLRTLVVQRLDAAGRVTVLLERLDDDTSASGVLAGPAIESVLAARPTAATLATVEDRLGGGIFGWDWTEDIAITEGDALVAFWSLAGLDPGVRQQLLRSRTAGEPGELLDKLERNLPEWFVVGTAYRSLAVDTDASGRPRERGAAEREAWQRHGAAGLLVDVRRMLDRGLRVEVLDVLVTGVVPDYEAEPPADGAPRPERSRVVMDDALRGAVVARLDALDLMDGFLTDLPQQVRQGRDHRTELLTVCAARSTPNLLRHIDALLRTGLDDWAVMSWEADLAFVLYRALPEAERVRFDRLPEIVAEMSADVRTWAGTNLLDAVHTLTERESVRRRLADERMWTASHAGRLRVLVGLGLALGDGAWVFEQSRLRRAFDEPALAEVVRDFGLATSTADVYHERTLDNRPWYAEGPFSYGTLLLGFLWVALRDAFAGTFAVDMLGGGVQHRRFDLAEMGTLLGGTAGPARFADRDGPTGAGPASNIASLELDTRANMLHLEVPELALDGLGLVRSGWSANVGTVRLRGLDVRATFETGSLRHPRTVDLDLPHTTLRDVTVTTVDSVLAAGQVVLDTMALHAAAASVEEHTAPGRGWWTYVPVLGPLVEYVRLLLTTLSLAVNGAGDLATGATEMRAAQVSLGSLTIDGLLVGGVPVERLSVADVSIGWGGTRGAYLQRLERTLTDRLEHVAPGPEHDRLAARLAAVQADLGPALADDRRLDDLMRRAARDPGSLSPEDHRAIADLQRGPGGFTVDTGRWTVTGIGDLAERATVEHVRGELGAGLATGGRMTDRARAERFTRSGPQSTAWSAYEGAGRLDLGTVDVQLTPPDLATLRRWRDEAAAAGGTTRVGRLDAAIEQREELDEVRARLDGAARSGRDPDPADRARADALLAALATTIHAEGAYLDANTVTGEIAVGADRVTGGPVDTTGFGVRRVDVEGLRVPVTASRQMLPSLVALGATLEGLDPQARREHVVGTARDAVVGAGLEVQRATLTDVRVGAGDEGLAEVVVTGLSGGRVTPVEGGIGVAGLHVGSITGRGARLRFGQHSVDAPGAVEISDIEASVVVLMDRAGEVTGVRLDEVAIGRVGLVAPERPADSPPVPGDGAPAPLTYTNLAAGVRVELFDGALRELWVRDALLDLTGPELLSSTGAEGGDRPMAGVRHVDGLRLAAAVGGFGLSTTLSSQPREAGAPGAITVGRAEQGGWFLDLAGLRLDRSEVRSPDGSVRVRRLDWASSRLRYDGEGIYLDGLDLPLVEVGALRWRVGTAGELSSTGGATIRGITATARARLVERDGERHVAEFLLPELRIASVTAEDLRYTDGPLTVSLRRLGVTDPAPVSIDDIVLTGVRWAPGAVTTFDLRTGPVGVAVDAGSGGTPGAALADRDWGFVGRLDASSLHVGRDWTGTFSGDVAHLNASGDVHAAGVGDATVAARNLSLAGVTFGGNVLSVPAPAAGAVSLGSLELSSMSFSGGGVTVSTVGRSVVRLEDLRTGFDIELVDMVVAHQPDTRRALSAIVLHELDAASLSTTGLRLQAPGIADVTISSGGARGSSVTGIRVRELRVEVEPRRGGGYRVTSWTYQQVHVDRVQLRDVAFDVPVDTTLLPDAAIGPPPPPPPPPPAGSVAAATAGDWVSAFAPLLDSLNGHVTVDLDLPVYVGGMNLGGHIGATIQVDAGEVDFVDLEAQLLEDLNIADSALDFEVEGSTLVFELDLSQIGPAAGAVGGAAVVGGATRNPWGAAGGAVVGGAAGAVAAAVLDRPLVTWDLTWAERHRALHDDRVRVARLVRPRASAPSSGPSPAEFDLANLVVHRLDIALSVGGAGGTPTTVSLPGGLGWVEFDGSALSGLTVSSSGIGARPDPSALPLTASLELGLDALRVRQASLSLPVGTLRTGAMRVENLRNTVLHLQRLARTGTTAAPGREHDTALGLRLVNLTGVAGLLDLTDLTLTPATPGGSGGP